MDSLPDEPAEESMTQDPADRCTQREEMNTELAPLRSVLATGQAEAKLALFDELVEQHEWEIALHVVCDYLLEPTARISLEAIIEQIRTLHEKMGLHDTCVADLQRKTHRC
jgi:hypothetical protein